jgi:hypothetical protein
MRLDRQLFERNAHVPVNLGTVAERLESALNHAGYTDRTGGYYSIPYGFAYAMRLEQINDDGSPREEPYRWCPFYRRPPLQSLSEYLRRLFRTEPGRYRVIVFFVTHPFSPVPEYADHSETQRWIESGYHELPQNIRNIRFSRSHICVAYVYEFIQETGDHPIKFVDVDRRILQASDHLNKTNIIEGLRL